MKKRSKYRPKPVNTQAHLLAMLGAAKISATDALKRAAPVALAVEDVAKGRATTDSWRDIFDAVNIAEELIRAKVAAGSIEDVQRVMVAILDRARATGVKAARASELAELRGFAADYATILSGATNQQFALAANAVSERIRRVMSSKRLPDDLVVVEAL